jgi:secreted trypsin-like serine protease
MSKRVRSFLGALLLSSLALPAAAVTFGAPDGNGHPFVGNILFERPDGYFSCSGTMMSPTVMLTAGHCTEEAGAVNLNTWVTFTPNVSLDTGCTTRKCLNAFLDKASNGWIRGTPHPHPQYDDFAQFPVTYDVGVIVLAKPVSMPTYGELPSLNFLNTIKSAAENRFTVVGYGLQGEIKPFASDIWARYVGTVKLVELNSTSDGGQSAKYTNNPGTGGGTCFGDSGGPIFYSNTNIVVSVVSWGLTPCIGVDYNFRTDIQTTQDFVKVFLK